MAEESGSQLEDRPSVFSVKPAATSGESHPGFKTEGTLADEMTGVDPADLGITRRQIILGALGGVLTLCGIGGVVTWLGSLGVGAVSSSPNELSAPYKELMNDAEVQKYAKNLSTEDKKTLLYNLTTTDAYLQEADSSQWGGLVKHLEAEGSKAYYGQMLSLKKAGCLNPQTNKLDRNLCERNKPGGSAINPGFKSLDEKTKLEYIGKFNSMVEQNP